MKIKTMETMVTILSVLMIVELIVMNLFGFGAVTLNWLRAALGITMVAWGTFITMNTQAKFKSQKTES